MRVRKPQQNGMAAPVRRLGLLRTCMVCVTVLECVTAAPTPTDLRCNFVAAQNSSAVPAKGPQPQLSWEPQPQQTAYRVLAASSAAGFPPRAADMLWDSGKIVSPLSVAVYTGPPVPSSASKVACWSVQLWLGADGPSDFASPAPLRTEMGPPYDPLRVSSYLVRRCINACCRVWCRVIAGYRPVAAITCCVRLPTSVTAPLRRSLG